MVKTFHLFIAALAADSVTARPIFIRDSGFNIGALVSAATTDTGDDSTVADTTRPGGFNSPQAQANQQAAAEAQQTKFAGDAASAASAEAAAGIDIQASIAAASSSAATVAATQTVNPTDPFPVNNHGLTPEELGQLAGLQAKLAIDTQFGDTAAEIKDNADISSLESKNDFTGAI